MKKMSYPKLSAALLLSALLSISGFSQDDKKPQAEAPVTPQPMPTIKYDPTPLPSNTPSYAPVVEKVAPSVVTISTLKLVSGKAPASPGMGKDNPLFNDPTFRRFVGLPDEDGSEPPTPRRRTPAVPPKGGDTGKNDKGGKRQPLGLGSGV